MAEFDTIRTAGVSSRPLAIDEGLKKHMSKTYSLMAIAMLITGAVAYVVGNNNAMLSVIFGSPLRWVVMFAPLAVVFGLSATINKLFWAFSALVGLSISYIFAVYTGMSISQTFLVTAIAFSGLSIWGYTTKKDISAWGSFLMMGVIGLIVASVINIFMASAAMQFAVSSIGVLIFAGLTAYDTQRIKNDYLQMSRTGNTDWLAKSAIMGALSLYLNFLNMFMFLLSFMGNRN
jgi:FtsH-binding integral membrane protein